MQPDLDKLCGEIRAVHRERQFAMGIRKKVDLALGAFLRRAEGWSLKLPEAERKPIEVRVAAALKAGEDYAKTGQQQSDPLYLRHQDLIDATIESRKPFNDLEHEALLQMRRLVRQLPIWAWAKDIPGVAEGMLGTIVGEAGNLSKYATVGKLNKRMGLAVLDGHRQGNPGSGATDADWIHHGYSAKRRSFLWVLGDVFVKVKGPYRAAYDRIKAEELAKAQARGQTVEPASTRTKKDPDHFMSVGHVHLRAKRRTEKLFLKHLHRQWLAMEAGAGRTNELASIKDHSPIVQPAPASLRDRPAA